MNITVIYGQRHKGNTWELTKMFLDKLTDSNSQISEFFLPEESIGYCTGCLTCINKDENSCPHIQATRKIVTEIDKADLIIISSPCYVLGMTGQLKTLFDHLAYRHMAHRPEPSMFQKQALAISTAAGTGMGKTAKAIADNLFMWGIARIYRYGLRIAAIDFEHISEKRKRKIKRRVNRIAQTIKKHDRRVNAGIKTRFMFSFMRLGQKNNDWNPIDKKYWQSHEWLSGEKPY